MENLAIIGVIAVTTLFSAFSAKADNIAYMGLNDGEFGTVDLNTGVFTLLGNSSQCSRAWLWRMGCSTVYLTTIAAETYSG
jgi:hypothetical protein